MKNLQIEGFRGILCLWIILFHYTTRYDQLFGHRASYPFNFDNGGECGVAAFLIITGFFIAASLGRISGENFINKANWIGKKMTRLYPTYWCSLTLTFISLSLWPLHNIEVGWKEYIVNMLFIYHPGVDFIDAAHWYVSAIFIGYCYFSIINMFPINKRNTFIGVTMFLLFAIWIYCENEFIYYEFIKKIQSVLYLKYISFMIVGYLWFNFQKRFVRNLKIFILFFLVCLVSIIMFANWRIFIIVIISCLLLSGVTIKMKVVTVIFCNAIVQRLGFVSYSWYLIHQRIGYQIINAIEIKSGNEIVLMLPLLVTFILAFIISKYLEPYLFNKIQSIWR